jgi:RNA polymerase sigma factor (TIGR02999 family)
MSDVTQLLSAIRAGDSAAADKLFPLVYQELRQLAAVHMARERAGHTLQATALVHEAWLRLGGEVNGNWNGAGHFFGAAAEAMRRILVDHARRKQAERRGGGKSNLNIADLEIAAEQMDDEQILAVNEALEKLAAVHPEDAKLVKLRYFAGLTLEQIAASQRISLAAAKRSWTFARAWLHREMQK